MHSVVRLQPLLIHLGAPLLVGAASSYLTRDMAGVYGSLALPFFAPPAAAFPIIWTILYLVMGFAAYLVYTERRISRPDRNTTMTLYGLTLLVGGLFNLLFFRYRLFGVAAVWTIVMLAATGLCAALFYRIRPLAGKLFFPALGWLAYVSLISFSVAAMN